MTSLKISIVVPVYNVAPYLHHCLDSVMKQDLSGCEVICVNDGSTDNSFSILEEYKKQYPQITLLSQENKGLSAARNAGIRVSTGDYILFLDSDDWLEKDAIRILRDHIGDEDMLCFNGRRYFEDGTQEEPDEGITETNLTGWDYYNKYALVNRKFHFVCVVLRLYRKQFLLDHRLFFEEGIYHEDNLFMPIACYYAQKVKVIPDCLYVYRIREGSIMQSGNVQRLYDMIQVANQLADFFISINDIDKSKLYREIAGEYFGVFISNNVTLFCNKDTELTKRIHWKSFKTVSVYPRHRRIYVILLIHPVLFRLYIRFEFYIKNTILIFNKMKIMPNHYLRIL
jgi:glycosyltransferase involved in cell wall biosynthesis